MSNGPALTALAELALADVRAHFARIADDRRITEEELAEHEQRLTIATEAADLADMAQAAAVALARRGPGSQRAQRLLAQITDPGWTIEMLLIEEGKTPAALSAG